ncbi:type I toxin-antitoxin system Fst family toxin [Listeria grayi]|nr:type I toxin-antitoxin system Fst family toxin [Listeria grayi]
MALTFSSIIAPIIAGCAITFFKHWLDHRSSE